MWRKSFLRTFTSSWGDPMRLTRCWNPITFFLTSLERTTPNASTYHSRIYFCLRLSRQIYHCSLCAQLSHCATSQSCSMIESVSDLLVGSIEGAVLHICSNGQEMLRIASSAQFETNDQHIYTQSRSSNECHPDLWRDMSKQQKPRAELWTQTQWWDSTDWQAANSRLNGWNDETKWAPINSFQITFSDFQKLLAWGSAGEWCLISTERSWKVRWG